MRRFFTAKQRKHPKFKRRWRFSNRSLLKQALALWDVVFQLQPLPGVLLSSSEAYSIFCCEPAWASPSTAKNFGMRRTLKWPRFMRNAWGDKKRWDKVLAFSLCVWIECQSQNKSSGATRLLTELLWQGSTPPRRPARTATEAFECLLWPKCWSAHSLYYIFVLAIAVASG